MPLSPRSIGDIEHLSDHNVLARLSDISATTPESGQVLKWNGSAWAPGTDEQGSGGTGFAANFNYQYVIPGNSDANNGRSPDTAKGTIQAAHDALVNTGLPEGGKIFLGPGTHTISSTVNITENGIQVIGAGEYATRVRITTSGIVGFLVTGHFAQFKDFELTDLSSPTEGNSGINAKTGIELNGARKALISRVRFNGIGQTADLGLDWANGPAALRVHGPTFFGDWTVVFNCDFRRCYRGMAVSSGANGWVIGCPFYSGTKEEKVYILKQGGADGYNAGDSVAWRFHGCHFTSSKQEEGGYSVKIDKTAAGGTSGHIQFTECFTEISGAAGGWGQYYSNLQDVCWVGCTFGAPAQSTPSGGPSIRVGTSAAENICGPYTGVGSQVFQRESGASATALQVWQATDYTGSVTAL
jgi:hypothetical protein